MKTSLVFTTLFVFAVVICSFAESRQVRNLVIETATRWEFNKP